MTHAGTDDLGRSHDLISHFVEVALLRGMPTRRGGQLDDSMSRALRDVAAELDRMVRRGVHDDDRRRGARAMRALARGWVTDEQLEYLTRPDGT